jgi:hypothetical protein
MTTAEAESMVERCCRACGSTDVLVSSTDQYGFEAALVHVKVRHKRCPVALAQPKQWVPPEVGVHEGYWFQPMDSVFMTAFPA